VKGGTGVRDRGVARTGRPFEMNGEGGEDHAHGAYRTRERVGKCIGVKGGGER
jgi:hypothetical protein